MRIRTIKPEFFTHEGLYELEAESGYPIRLAFAGLWCAADREGRFKWEPRRLGIQILPYDEVDFSRVLDALASRGFVLKYASDSRDFGVIPSFKTHQVINNKEKESILPEPCNFKDCDAMVTREPRDGHATWGKGKEGKGKEGNNMSDSTDTALFDNQAIGESDILLNEIWEMTPPLGRQRSGKQKLKSALKKANARHSEVLVALAKWVNCDEWTRDDGQYVPGIHRWINDGKWREEPVKMKPRKKQWHEMDEMEQMLANQ